MVLNLNLKKDKVLIGGEVRRGAWRVGSPFCFVSLYTEGWASPLLLERRKER